MYANSTNPAWSPKQDSNLYCVDFKSTASAVGLLGDGRRGWIRTSEFSCSQSRRGAAPQHTDGGSYRIRTCVGFTLNDLASHLHKPLGQTTLVLRRGVEPPRLAALVPKTSVYTVSPPELWCTVMESNQHLMDVNQQFCH